MAAESDFKALQTQMSAAELNLKSVAGLAQVETLAVVVEEQRLRIDSILHGLSKRKRTEIMIVVVFYTYITAYVAAVS